MKIAVVGGGIAGLATALAVRDRDPQADVVVLEASSRAGGNLRTERLHGCLVEAGPNGFLDNAPDTLALVKRLGLDERLMPSSDSARHRFIFRGGRLHALPTSPLGFLTNPLLSRAGRLRVLGEPFIRRRRSDGDESIHAFAARRLGTEAAAVLIDSMVTGIFAGDADRLSLAACFPLMVEMERTHGSLMRAMVARRRQRRTGSPAPMGGPAGRLTSFVGGVQDLVDAAVAALGAQTIHTRAPVVEVRPTDGGPWRLRLESGTELHADAVALAAGAAVTANLLGRLDAELAGALRAIPTAPVAVVAVGLHRARSRALDGFGFLVPPGEALGILGALWDSSIFPNRAPDDQMLVRVLIGGARDPESVRLDDEALVARALQGLHAALGPSLDVAWTSTVRHSIGIPQYTLGHPDRLQTIERRLLSLPGLVVTGNSYRGVSINACLTDAGRTAGALLQTDRRVPAAAR